MFKLRGKYIILTIVLFLTEVLIAVYVHDSIIRPNVGDFLVVILLYCFVRGFFNVNVIKAAISVLIFSYIVEFLQYLHIVQILGLEKNKIARIVIGSSFSWVDILCYTLGILFVLIFERKIFFRSKG
jgi:hypothetical protein